jgi:hypothetical protein
MKRASFPLETRLVIAGHSPSKTGVNALMTRQSIFLNGASFKMDARIIGERKRCRSSNGYARA